jgi:beta-glucosidase
LSISDAQNLLVKSVAAVQQNTIVVIHTPGAILMPWIDQVKAIVCAFLPGQEDGNFYRKYRIEMESISLLGNAIASILFGDVNPAGKLAVTFPKTQEEIPVNKPIQYPGIDNEAYYLEGLLVGYRWYDAKNVTPLFPFGHGLSYPLYKILFAILLQERIALNVKKIH